MTSDRQRHLLFRAASVLLAMLALVFACQGAFAGKRVALVVGISRYDHAPSLANPANDSADMAKLLRDGGFEVTQSQDADRVGLANAIRRFAEAIPGADVAVFYYAGHGIQIGDRNYLIPKDADIAQPYDAPLQAVELASILAPMEAGSRVSLIFLDACRDNPFAGALKLQGRSLGAGGGLARIDAGVGTLIAFATSPGQISADGAGRNSPFTAALLKVARTPGLEIQQLLKRVRAEVVATTQGRQVPWENSSLVGDVYLVPPAPAAAAAPAAPAPVAQPAEGQTCGDGRQPVAGQCFGEASLPVGEAAPGAPTAGEAATADPPKAVPSPIPATMPGAAAPVPPRKAEVVPKAPRRKPQPGRPANCTSANGQSFC